MALPIGASDYVVYANGVEYRHAVLHPSTYIYFADCNM